jgi:hypothetical protein
MRIVAVQTGHLPHRADDTLAGFGGLRRLQDRMDAELVELGFDILAYDGPIVTHAAGLILTCRSRVILVLGQAATLTGWIPRHHDPARWALRALDWP